MLQRVFRLELKHQPLAWQLSNMNYNIGSFLGLQPDGFERDLQHQFLSGSHASPP